MTETVEHLLKNSRLPGPRSNLELMYSFAKSATAEEVNECLSFYRDNLQNSPEEFVAVCGIVGYSILNRNNIKEVVKNIRKYASHNSWRIREAVAIGIQEIAGDNLEEIIDCLGSWLDDNELEKRAVVAALCEPKLLKEEYIVKRVLEILTRLTMEFEKNTGKITDNGDTLRKALGYGWSVAIVSLPEQGEAAFERIAASQNKHIRWVVKENLKKRRLAVMDKKWVDKMNNSNN